MTETDNIAAIADSTICPGSEKPTRTDGSCDRCGAPEVRGEYKPTEIAENITDHIGELREGVFIPPTRFAVFPSLGYWEAKQHKSMKAEQNKETPLDCYCASYLADPSIVYPASWECPYHGRRTPGAMSAAICAEQERQGLLKQKDRPTSN